ncbi:MAG: hypothetical protein FI687_03875 [SAR202 cluster bacterium]|mgnify:FL=1|nr:hypothetical protein [SAR202 cluster bacterium]
MIIKRMKILLVFLLVTISLVSCSNEPEPVSVVQPQDNGIQLPLETWPTVSLKKLSMKWNSCVINENGDPIQIGTRVLVVERAQCDEVVYNPDSSIGTIRTGMVKIRILDTGQEVWTWSSAANIKNSSRLNP